MTSSSLSVEMTKENCDIRTNFDKSLKKWVEENIEEIAKSHGDDKVKKSSWVEEVRVEHDSRGWFIAIHVIGGDDYYYDIPFQYVYDAEFRANYPQYLIEKRAEEQRLADLKAKERIEVAIKMEMARYKELHEKYGGKI